MVGAVVVQTKPITRNKLSSFLPNHELVKALENLTADVGTTLPDAADEIANQVTDLSSRVIDLESQVSSLNASVSMLQSEVEDLQQQVSQILDGGDGTLAAISALREQLVQATRAIDDLNIGPP